MTGMKPGNYIQEHLTTNEDNEEVHVLSAHRVNATDDVIGILHSTLDGIAERARVSRIQATLAGLRNSHGWRLNEQQLESRAALIMRYKSIGPVWIKKHGSHNWAKFKRCLDFNAPDMHARILDYQNNIHLVNPDGHAFMDKHERLLTLVEARLEEQAVGISKMRKSAKELHSQADSFVRSARVLEDESKQLRSIMERYYEGLNLSHPVVLTGEEDAVANLNNRATGLA